MGIFLRFCILSLFIYFGCSTTKTSTTLIMFTDEVLPPTKPVEIAIYNSRLDLPGKYIEIGTIKFEGNPKVEDIKKVAAEKGSDAILLEGNNYILIKFENQNQEGKDEKKSI